MWDNRVTKRNPRAPDYKCQNRSCDGVVWPSKPSASEAQEERAGGKPTVLVGAEEEELPF
jgi:hypothetical protein